MDTKILKFGLIMIFAVGCVVMFFQYILLSFSSSPVFAQTASGLPLRIMIPRINVDAVIEGVSQSGNGLIGPPRIALNTSWYKLGPKPGEKGTAVISGYVHWKYGYTAMFADLHFLKPGDTVAVKDDMGMTTSFIVRESKIYNSDTDFIKISNLNDGKSHLNLITNDGIWDKPSKSYSNRLVVFTDKAVATTTLP